MRAEDPLALRDQLQSELASAHHAEHAAREFIRHVQQEIDRTSTARIEQYTARARGYLEDGEALATLEGEWEDARASLERSQQKLQAAQSAVKIVQTEIEHLYVEHLAAFAAEAETATALAATALDELRGPYARARDAWALAARAWQPLAPAIAATIQATESEHGQWRGSGAAQAAARVPDLPLPPADFLDGLPAARPPGLRLPAEVAS